MLPGTGPHPWRTATTSRTSLLVSKCWMNWLQVPRPLGVRCGFIRLAETLWHLYTFVYTSAILQSRYVEVIAAQWLVNAHKFSLIFTFWNRLNAIWFRFRWTSMPKGNSFTQLLPSFHETTWWWKWSPICWNLNVRTVKIDTALQAADRDVGKRPDFVSWLNPWKLPEIHVSSINQSVSQSINQSINQLINQFQVLAYLS